MHCVWQRPSEVRYLPTWHILIDLIAFFKHGVGTDVDFGASASRWALFFRVLCLFQPVKSGVNILCLPSCYDVRIRPVASSLHHKDLRLRLRKKTRL